MPYNLLKSEIANRFLEVNHLLNSIKSVEDSLMPPAAPPVDHKIIKGLFYVHLYASIEFCFHKLTTHTLGIIKAKNVLYKDFDNKFYTIALSSNLQSIRDCNSKSFLDKSADLFLETESSTISNFSDSFINQYLQNIWGKSFNQLTKTIGLNVFPITQIEITIFNEVVENRNKVAHGRDMAQNVGSSPQYQDLKNKYDVITDVLSRYVLHFEAFFNTKEYIKTPVRANY